MARITLPEMYLEMAETVAKRSTCSRLQVGCVVTNSEMTTAWSLGYNGSARGLPNGCDSDTPGACGCLHAEDNALLKAPYHEGALFLFCTHSPCATCAKRIINSRVTRVYYRTLYRSDAGLALLRTGKIEVVHLPPFEAVPIPTYCDCCPFAQNGWCIHTEAHRRKGLTGYAGETFLS